MLTLALPKFLDFKAAGSYVGCNMQISYAYFAWFSALIFLNYEKIPSVLQRFSCTMTGGRNAQFSCNWRGAGGRFCANREQSLENAPHPSWSERSSSEKGKGHWATQIWTKLNGRRIVGKPKVKEEEEMSDNAHCIRWSQIPFSSAPSFHSYIFFLQHFWLLDSQLLSSW